jgi:hypothetical protein
MMDLDAELEIPFVLERTEILLCLSEMVEMFPAMCKIDEFRKNATRR